MIHYTYPSIFFKKEWHWFDAPHDVEGADMITFFSYDDAKVLGFKKKKGLTSRIDLSQSEDELWNAMRKSFIRKQIRRGERNEVVIRQDNNFKSFKSVYTAFRKQKGIHADRYSVLQQHGTLFSAYYQGKLVAGGVFIADKVFMRAWVLASLRLEKSDGALRDIIGQANRMVLWEAIKYAKENGCGYFDLGGIRPDSEMVGDSSLSEFKESFGGKRVATFYYVKIYSIALKKFMRVRKYFTL